MTSQYPGAHQAPVRNHGGAMTAHLGLVLHVQQGTHSLAAYFDQPQTDPRKMKSSTWWVSAAGVVEQYVDADMQAWAQAAGNATYNSVETEGYDTDPLTAAQVSALAGIYAWGHVHYGWPLSLADRVGVRGLGWHGMGGAAWGNHPNCPGNKRKAQRATVLTQAASILNPDGTHQEGDDVFMYLHSSGHAVLVIAGKQVQLSPTHANALSTTVPYVRAVDAAQEAVYAKAFGAVTT